MPERAEGVLTCGRPTSTGKESLLLELPLGQVPVDWSRVGRFLLYKSMRDPATGVDLWALPLEGDRTPIPVARTNADETSGAFSPDGKWIAIESDETGRREIYVQGFPHPSASARLDRWRAAAKMETGRQGTVLRRAGWPADGRFAALRIRRSDRDSVVAPAPLRHAREQHSHRRKPAGIFRVSRWPAASDEHAGRTDGLTDHADFSSIVYFFSGNSVTMTRFFPSRYVRAACGIIGLSTFL